MKLAFSFALSLALALAALAACGGAKATPPSSSSGAASEGTFASHDGAPVFYRVAGQGEPAVVLVHCWGCSSDEWRDAMPALAASHRVVAIDLPGHGRSGKQRADWTVPAYANDLRATLDHFHLERAILVGHSMSGAIIVQAAVDEPKRVVGLVPVDTLLDATRGEDPAEIAAFFGGMRKDFKGVAEKLVRSLFPANADRAVVDRVVAFELANDPAIAIAVLENNWKFEVKDRFAQVKAPIIAINATTFPTNVEANRSLAPQYQVKLIEGTGHWPMLEAPAKFNALLVQTVADITAAASPAAPAAK